MKKTNVGLVLIALVVSVHAQEKGVLAKAASAKSNASAYADLCSKAELHIEALVKDVAVIESQLQREDSAARATVKNLQIVSAYQQIDSALNQMNTWKCNPLQWIPTSLYYKQAAEDCALASRAIGESRDQYVKKSCDRSNWVRSER
jgi:predicted signal transduction protein with EAL and GGDEF domain